MENLVGLAVLIVVFFVIVVATRKRPDRRHDNKPPMRGEADIDDWGNI